jgi:hypothetical protein
MALAGRHHPVQASLLLAILLLCTAQPPAGQAGAAPVLAMGVVVPCLG